MSDFRSPDWLARRSPEVRPFVWGRVSRSAPPNEPARSGDADDAGDALDGASPESGSTSSNEAEEARAAAEEAAKIAAFELASARAEITRLLAEKANAEAAIAALQANVTKLGEEHERERSEFGRKAESELVKLAIAVARRIVDGELATKPELVVTWARKALAASELGEDIVVAVGSEIAATVPEDAWAELAPHLTIDEELPPYGSELRAGERIIDFGQEARFSLVADHLGVDLDEPHDESSLEANAHANVKRKAA